MVVRGAVRVLAAVHPMITMTVSGDRPGYLAQTLDSWSRVRGLRDWSFAFAVEPGERLDACRAVMDGFAARRVARRVDVAVNQERRGVLANPHGALVAAFGSGAPFVVLAEEDIVVGDDVVEYFAVHRHRLAGDPRVLALCAFSRLGAPQDEDVVTDGEFSPWVWGTWADRWATHLGPRWFDAARAPADGEGSGFDFGICRIRAAADLRVITPLASRSDNIGRDGGVHALPEDFEASRAPTFAAHRAPVAWRSAPPAAHGSGRARRVPGRCPLTSGDDEHAGGPVDRGADRAR